MKCVVCDFVNKCIIFLFQGMRGREGAEEGPLRHSHELPRTAQGAEISKPGEKIIDKRAT